MDRLKSDLAEGRLSPESRSVRRLFWRAERRGYRARMKERAYTTLHDMLKARDVGIIDGAYLIQNWIQ